jgi:hypothetical protein
MKMRILSIISIILLLISCRGDTSDSKVKKKYLIEKKKIGKKLSGN